MRLAAKIDANQNDLIAEFERLGCAVHSTAGMGRGFPDLLVWYRGHHLVEVKSERGKLTGDQVKFIAKWPGPVHIVRNFIHVKALVQIWRNEND